MAANFAVTTFSRYAPAALDAAKKVAPQAVDKAKKYVATALNIPMASVQMDKMMSPGAGQNVQLATEALVRSGVPVSALFNAVPKRDQRTLGPIREELEALASQIDADNQRESDDAANRIDKTPEASVSTAMQIYADNRMIERACNLVGLDVDRLWELKVALDHLDLGKIANYKVMKGRG